LLELKRVLNVISIFNPISWYLTAPIINLTGLKIPEARCYSYKYDRFGCCQSESISLYINSSKIAPPALTYQNSV